MERVGIQEVRRGRRTAGEQQLRQEEANGGSGSERDGSPAEDHSLRFHSERPLLLSAAAGREVEPFPAQQRAESAARAPACFQGETRGVGGVLRRTQVGCDVDHGMSPDVAPERDEVAGGGRATAVCPSPAAPPLSSR